MEEDEGFDGFVEGGYHGVMLPEGDPKSQGGKKPMDDRLSIGFPRPTVQRCNFG